MVRDIEIGDKFLVKCKVLNQFGLHDDFIKYEVTTVQENQFYAVSIENDEYVKNRNIPTVFSREQDYEWL